MDKILISRQFFLLFIVAFTIGLYFFYLKYVPQVESFQVVLAPLLFIVFILTSLKVKWGTLFFIFCFPLINGLPYFFGIFEHTPHAPTALVLFLFYFFGWLVNSFLFRAEPYIRDPVLRPMFLISLIIVVSGAITIFRYSNFVPFLNDRVYELITNTNGVSAGGAIMSTLFSSLNYLTGFAFFFILLQSLNSQEYSKKVLIVLLVSTSLAIAFGFYQHFVDISLGNTPSRTLNNTLNGTFKDPLSFGAYLGAIIPLLFGVIFAFGKLTRIVSIIALAGGLFILAYTGSLSGYLVVTFSVFMFLVLLVKMVFDVKNSNPNTFIKIVTSLGLIFFITIILVSGYFISKDSSTFIKIKQRIIFARDINTWDNFVSGRLSYFWKLAGSMIRDYPISGVGIGSYIIELPNYAVNQQKSSQISDSAENYILQVGSELGLVGVFFFLWIFWEIIKQIMIGLGRFSAQDRWKYIQIGVSLGIISYFMIFQVHTFIGSYEIKYTFWLLVALLFSLNASKKNAFEKLSFPIRFKVISLFVIILFSSAHLWNSWHSLSLKSRTEQFNLKQEFGFYQIEKTDTGKEFRWTGRNAGLTLAIEKQTIEIPLLASHPDIKNNPVKVEIYITKDFFRTQRLLDEIVLTENIWKTYDYSLQDYINQEVILLFKVSRTWNPLKILGTPDPRHLGVAIGEMRFVEESTIP